MSVLSACQDASRLMGKSAPTALYASSDPYAVELAALANESAKAIAKAHDWRVLTTLQTQAGDGATTAFDLPADYDRMPKQASVFLASQQRALVRIDSLDTWLERRMRDAATTGEWIMLGGKLNIAPAMAASDSASFYYQSNRIVAPQAGDNKAAFTLDSDTFRLAERLLTLDLIWRWRAMKKLDYAEEMANFEIAMAQEAARDKGARVLKVGRARMPSDAQDAYPGVLGS